MNETSDRLTARYGGPIVSRTVSRLLIALGGIVFFAVVALVGLAVSRPEVRSDVVSYDHVADDVIAVEFQVTMDPGTIAACQVQALNKGRAQVGFVEVEIPAQTARQTLHEVEISTQGEAVAVEVVGCTAR